MSLLDMRAVTAGYGQVQILDALDLDVGAGEIVAILGSNGSGKSTALKTAIGLTTMVSGNVHFNDQDITALPPNKRAALGMAYVPQTDNVFTELTVDENLRMGAYLKPEREAAGCDQAFTLFPRLAQRRQQPAMNLSGGERRMLSIAQALLLQPKLLLLDEPSADLAPNVVDTVFEAIEEIHHQLGIPILLVEQNVSKALELAHRTYVLVRGRTAHECPAEDVDVDHLKTLFIDGGAGAAAQPGKAG